MTTLSVITREGDTLAIDAQPGLSVMEVIRDGGVDEMLALCGGCLSCATCHVYVDDDFLPLLPPVSADEADLLDSSEHRTARSRLCCQVPFTASLNGLRVTIAPEE